MKAAVLEAFGQPVILREVPQPVLGTGEVIVDVVAAGVLPYLNEVISNERRYMLALPIVLGAGAVGRVRATGPDATRLSVGDWVLCDPTVRSRDDASTPDITLQGLSSRGPGGMHLQAYYHDGSYAQQMRVPTENAIPLGEIAEAEAGRWCATQTLLVPYGGLLAAGFQAGENAPCKWRHRELWDVMRCRRSRDGRQIRRRARKKRTRPDGPRTTFWLARPSGRHHGGRSGRPITHDGCRAGTDRCGS